MAQYARPSSDISASGWSSTGGSYYTEIDESTPNDADYIYALAASTGTVEVKCSAVSTPGAGSRYLVVRWCDNWSSGLSPSWSSDCEISLVEGTTVLHTFQDTPPHQATYADQSFDISAYNPSAWNDLRIRLKKGGGGNGMYVSQAYIQIPDAVPGSGGFTVVDTTATAAAHDVDRDTYPTYEANNRVSVGDDPTGTRFQTRYAPPKDAFDAANGQYCTLSGQWVPGHLVVWVDGAPYAQGNAPRPVRLLADPSEMMF